MNAGKGQTVDEICQGIREDFRAPDLTGVSQEVAAYISSLELAVEFLRMENRAYQNNILTYWGAIGRLHAEHYNRGVK